MSIQRYKQAKNVALSVAIMLATSAMLTGCRSEIEADPVPISEIVNSTSDIKSDGTSYVTNDSTSDSSSAPALDDEVTLEDLYVESNGSYIGYRDYAETNDIDANTKFFTYDWKTTKYNPWTPQLEDWNYLKGLDEEDGSDVYVQESSGSVIPYFMWWGLMSSSQRSSMAYNNVNFVTPTADGKYATYKPSTAELNQIKEGKFVGKTPNRPAVKATNINGTGKVSTLTKSSSGITTKTSTGTSTGTTTTKSTGATTSNTTNSGTTGKSTSVTTPSTSTSTSTGGSTSSFGGSTTRSGGGTTSSGGGGSISTGG